MKYTTLGNTGLTVSRAGFGVLTMGASQMDLPLERGAEVICHALENGINFFDTAEYYETYKYIKAGIDLFTARRRAAVTGAAEACSRCTQAPSAFAPECPQMPGTGAAEAGRFNGSSQMQCGSQLPGMVISSKSFANTAEWMEESVNEALTELGTDRIDIFLLHEVRGMWDFRFRRPAWEKLAELKSAGVIGCIGVSTHQTDVAAAMADIPECDVVFPLYNKNSLGIRTGDGFGTADEMRAAIAACSKAGKGVYTMKAFGGGNLTADYQPCLDFVYGTPGVDSVMIGMAAEREVDDICSYVGGTMDPAYRPATRHKKMRVDLSDCIGCGSCEKKCSSGAIKVDPATEKAHIDHSICVTCGYCAPVCPERAIIMY